MMEIKKLKVKNEELGTKDKGQGTIDNRQD